MSVLTIDDGYRSVTIKPHRYSIATRFAVKAELGFVISVIDTPDARSYDVFAYVDPADAYTLSAMNVYVYVTSTFADIPSGNYYLETVEVRADTKFMNKREVRITLLQPLVE